MRTSTPSTSHDGSFWRNNLLAVPSCRRVIETKSGQNLMFDPGGSKGRLRACPFLGMWRALLCGKIGCNIFLRKEDLGSLFAGGG